MSLVGASSGRSNSLRSYDLSWLRSNLGMPHALTAFTMESRPALPTNGSDFAGARKPAQRAAASERGLPGHPVGDGMKDLAEAAGCPGNTAVSERLVSPTDFPDLIAS